MCTESPVLAHLVRSVIGVMAVVALVGQLLAPSMAHAAAGTTLGDDWIEICADTGPVLVRLRDDGTVEKRAPQTPSHGTCPKCLTCVTCAGVTGMEPVLITLTGFAPVAFALAGGSETGAVFVREAWERPMTRGPPCVPQEKNEMARAGHVMAVTLKTGGAL